jgi:membrane protease YdiL (CAAX protease family)
VRALLWLAITGAFAALTFYAVSQADDRGEDTVYSYDVLASAVVAYGLLAVIVYALTQGLPRRELLGLCAPRSWWRGTGLALGGVVAALIGAAILLALTGAGDEQNLAPEDWDGSRAGAYAASFLAIVFIGPVVEELLYRGAGIGLFERWGAPVAVGVTALMFGLGHGLLLSFPAFLWFGVVTGWLRVHTGSLYPPVLAHCVFNAVGMLLPLFV